MAKTSTLFVTLIILFLAGFALAGWVSYADSEARYYEFTRHTVDCSGNVIELNEMSASEASHWAVEHCPNGFQLLPN